MGRNLSELLQTVESEYSDPSNLSEVDLFRKLAGLDALKKMTADLERLITKLRAPLEEQALTRFEQMGINNFNIDGRTVYLHREWWAKASRACREAIAALKAPESASCRDLQHADARYFAALKSLP